MTKLPERNLDVLRACAVLSVWVAHLSQTLRQQVGDHGLGRVGVLAFFVHTALVLMSSIERTGDSERGWVRTFYLRRAARVYPLVWVTIALCVGADLAFSTVTQGGVPILSSAAAHTWRAVWTNALLVQNLAGAQNVVIPLWTLPLEMQMYLLLPAAYLLARRRGVRAVLLALAAAAVVEGVVPFMPWPGIKRITVLAFVPCFMSGVLAYAMLRRKAPSLPSWSWFALVPLWWIGALLAPITLLPIGWAACLILGACIAATNELPQSVVTRASAVIAKYSFGIYLLHMPAWSIAFDKTGDSARAVQWGLYAVLLVGMPVAAYHLIEMPAINWMRHRRPTSLRLTGGLIRRRAT